MAIQQQRDMVVKILYDRFFKKKSSKPFKGSAPKALPLIYILYPIFVLGDLLTTYIGTPDLKYEGNVIINWLRLGWFEIIVLTLISVTLVIWLSLIAKRKPKTIFFYAIHLIFYAHYYITIFSVINNAFSGIYLHNKVNFLTYPIAESYVKTVTFFHPYFYTGINTLLFAIVTFSLVWHWRTVKK